MVPAINNFRDITGVFKGARFFPSGLRVLLRKNQRIVVCTIGDDGHVALYDLPVSAQEDFYTIGEYRDIVLTKNRETNTLRIYRFFGDDSEPVMLGEVPGVDGKLFARETLLAVDNGNREVVLYWINDEELTFIGIISGYTLAELRPPFRHWPPENNLLKLSRSRHDVLEPKYFLFYVDPFRDPAYGQIVTAVSDPYDPGSLIEINNDYGTFVMLGDDGFGPLFSDRGKKIVVQKLVNGELKPAGTIERSRRESLTYREHASWVMVTKTGDLLTDMTMQITPYKFDNDGIKPVILSSPMRNVHSPSGVELNHDTMAVVRREGSDDEFDFYTYLYRLIRPPKDMPIETLVLFSILSDLQTYKFSRQNLELIRRRLFLRIFRDPYVALFGRLIPDKTQQYRELLPYKQLLQRGWQRLPDAYRRVLVREFPFLDMLNENPAFAHTALPAES